MSTDQDNVDPVDGPDAAAAEAPRQPDVWVDDDGATRIEAFDPAMLEALAAAHFPQAPAATPTHAPAEPVRPDVPVPVPAPQPAARVVAIPPLKPRRAPERESRPAVERSADAVPPGPALPGSDIHAAIAAIDMDLEPPPPAAAPTPAPVVRAPARGPLFEPELGPEPTQIGAMPLISFGQTRPLVALVGEQHHASVVRDPGPQATFLPDSRPPFYKDKRVRIAAGAVAAILLLVLILLVAR